jgi:hypothetical protein
MKIPLLGAELFHGDRETDVMKLFVAFRSFANAPKSDSVFWILRLITHRIVT